MSLFFHMVGSNVGARLVFGAGQVYNGFFVTGQMGGTCLFTDGLTRLRVDGENFDAVRAGKKDVPAVGKPADTL